LQPRPRTAPRWHWLCLSWSSTLRKPCFLLRENLPKCRYAPPHVAPSVRGKFR
jgi:hypothetical protein